MGRLIVASLAVFAGSRSAFRAMGVKGQLLPLCTLGHAATLTGCCNLRRIAGTLRSISSAPRAAQTTGGLAQEG
jgi:hypothetical protein